MKTKIAVFFLLFVLFINVCVASDNAAVAIEEIRLEFERCRWTKVESLASVILALQPQNQEVHYYLGRAELAADKLQQAQERFNWLCHAEPDNADYRFALAMSLHLLGNDEQARIQAAHASNLSPNNSVYASFLASLTVDVLNVASISVKTMLHESGSAEVLKGETSPGTEKPSPYQQELMDLASKLKSDIKGTVQNLYVKVESEPEILADPCWTVVADEINKQQTDGKHEIIRRFLLWRSGELNHKDFESWLNIKFVSNQLKNDESLRDMAIRLENSGFRLSGSDATQAGQSKSLWFHKLAPDTAEAFMNAHYKLAWNLHMQNSAVATPLWHYQAGRLALELWQTEGSGQPWLKLANDHLEECTVDAQLGKDARVLLAEIARYMARR